jgi:Family of unknown function (DUF6441)
MVVVVLDRTTTKACRYETRRHHCPLAAGRHAGRIAGLERAVAAGTKSAGQGLKTELRRQVTSAGLGQRLANSWRDKHFSNRKLDAASLIYTKAPQIIRAFDEGRPDPEPARALSRDPDRERAEEGHRRQADQPMRRRVTLLRAVLRRVRRRLGRCHRAPIRFGDTLAGAGCGVRKLGWR